MQENKEIVDVMLITNNKRRIIRVEAKLKLKDMLPKNNTYTMDGAIIKSEIEFGKI